MSLIVILLLLSIVVVADSDHGNFSEAKELLGQNIPYDQLTDDQFELLGDYFMDLQTGDNHEFMDAMMGGEGSESLRQMHINMGQRFYAQYTQTGESPSFNTNTGFGMMGGGMMGSNLGGEYNMMSGYGFGMGLLGITYLALATFIFSLIFWHSYNWIVKGKK